MVNIRLIVDRRALSKSHRVGLTPYTSSIYQSPYQDNDDLKQELVKPLLNHNTFSSLLPWIIVVLLNKLKVYLVSLVTSLNLFLNFALSWFSLISYFVYVSTKRSDIFVGFAQTPYKQLQMQPNILQLMEFCICSYSRQVRNYRSIIEEMGSLSNIASYKLHN